MSFTESCSSHSLSPGRHDNSSDLERESGYEHFVRVCRNHSRVIVDYTVLPLSACIVAGQAFPKLPHLIPRTAQVALAYIGLARLPEWAPEFYEKCLPDVREAWQEGDRLGVVMTAIKATSVSLDIFFTFSGAVIYSLALCGQSKVPHWWYGKLRPLFVLSTIAQITVTIYQSILKQAIRESLDAIYLDSDIESCPIQSIPSLGARTYAQLRLSTSFDPENTNPEPLSINRTARQSLLGLYRNTLRRPLNATLYRIPQIRRLGRRIERTANASIENSIDLANYSLPSRAQVKRSLMKFRWDEVMRVDGTRRYHVLQNILAEDRMNGTADTALWCTREVLWRTGQAYPEAQPAIMLTSAILTAVVSRWCYHRNINLTENNSPERDPDSPRNCRTQNYKNRGYKMQNRTTRRPSFSRSYSLQNNSFITLGSDIPPSSSSESKLSKFGGKSNLNFDE